jgi:hypothetical protein
VLAHAPGCGDRDVLAVEFVCTLPIKKASADTSV